MRIIKLLTLLLALLVATGSQGRHVKKQRIRLKDMHIGFYHGATLLDVSHNTGTVTKKYVAAATDGIYFGFPFINQFRSEVGISMNNILLSNRDRNKNIFTNKGSYISIPLSVQYYILPKKCKIQPYFGFGAMVVPDADRLLFTKNSDGLNLLQGPGTINMLITQGVNIEINTHIRLTESLHIMSSEGRTSYGLNLGVNLYVP